jgi:hypothetical protein
VKEAARRRRRRRRRRKIVLGRHSLLQKIISLHKKITRGRGRRRRRLINQQDSDSEICRRRESVSLTYTNYFSESYLPARWALSKSGSKP